jgi:8-oxo-dGTP pyrophosphatase MutT (NUDIX family)
MYTTTRRRRVDGCTDGQVAAVRASPPEMRSLVRAYLDGETTVAQPVHAATVVLLRGRSSEREAFMLRRATSMAAFGGNHVFPGGVMDPTDAVEVPWAGPGAAEWAIALGCDPSLARALVVTAARETFEECGVMLAGPPGGGVVAATDGSDWESDRRALVAHELAFGELLNRRSLVLRSDLLFSLSRWVTPEWAPRRYDTRFFAAEVPPGQEPRAFGEESTGHLWISPRDAWEQHEAGNTSFMLPTVSSLSLVEGDRDGTDRPLRNHEMDPVTFGLVGGDDELRVVCNGLAGATDVFAVGVGPLGERR